MLLSSILNAGEKVMSVKASVSISEQQERYVRGLVEDGRYSSVSAVVQQGLDLLQKKTDAEEAEVEALKLLLSERQAGSFESGEKFKTRIGDMLNAKRRKHGLED
jgi:antitoxin ParD1/3/4